MEIKGYITLHASRQFAYSSVMRLSLHALKRKERCYGRNLFNSV